MNAPKNIRQKAVNDMISKRMNNYTEQQIFRTIRKLRQQGKTPLRTLAEYRSIENRIRTSNKKIKKQYAAIAQNRSNAEQILKNEKESRAKLLKLRDKLERKVARDSVSFIFGATGITAADWIITQGPKVQGRTTSIVKLTPETSIVARHAEQIVRKHCSKDWSRSSIVTVLGRHLAKRTKFGVVRIDVKEFYDSINHAILLDMIKRDARIDSVTYAICESFVKACKKQPGRKRQGLATGVFLSNTLAEYYLTKIDERFRNAESVVYFARYVDDIIVVTETEDGAESIFQDLTEALRGLKLEINTKKSYWFATDSQGQFPEKFTTVPGEPVTTNKLNYLGYEFCKKQTFRIEMSKNRIDRVIERMEKAYQVWASAKRPARMANTGADGLLVKRLQALSMNYRLWGEKSQAKTGIYFANECLSMNCASLKKLNGKHKGLRSKYSSQISQRLSDRLDRIDFEQGHIRRDFVVFKRSEINAIFGIWR